jgi:hypothetical protein
LSLAIAPTAFVTSFTAASPSPAPPAVLQTDRIDHPVGVQLDARDLAALD